MRKHAVLEVILGNMQYWRSCSTGGHIGKHAVLEVYWETCSTGGEEHAVLEVLVRKHAVLEVLVRNMQYWRS